MLIVTSFFTRRIRIQSIGKDPLHLFVRNRIDFTVFRQIYPNAAGLRYIDEGVDHTIVPNAWNKLELNPKVQSYNVIYLQRISLIN